MWDERTFEKTNFIWRDFIVYSMQICIIIIYTLLNDNEKVTLFVLTIFLHKCLMILFSFIILMIGFEKKDRDQHYIGF